MKKLKGAEGGGNWNANCPGLRDACDGALRNAFDNDDSLLLGVRWPDTYGNHVSGKGTLVGESSCPTCGKRVRVTLTLPSIDGVTDYEGRPTRTKVYDLLAGTTTFNISGTECTQTGKPVETF